jgi:predicted alpha/beta hydrolase family esterase/EAL domain-containing protein (putative c-di-GMP-specific phosphodiesterase class I)
MKFNMLLAQLVTHFNQPMHRSSAQASLLLEENAVIARFYGIRMESGFAVLRNPAGQIFGHQAQLRAFSPRGKSISARAPYAVALDEDSIVELDRLIRTLHVLNATSRELPGPLFLEVHPWHIARVPRDHGAVFADILHDCGWSPQQIVLEIADAAVQDADRIVPAIDSFHHHGFRIALHQRGIHDEELERLLVLQPELIQLGAAHLQAAEASADQGRELAQRIQRIHHHGIGALLHGVTTEHQAQIAGWVNADGYQDCIPPSPEAATVIIVPGLDDSGPEHWQTLWGAAHPTYQRVRQRDWRNPQVDDWVEALDREIRRAPHPPILVGHSLGCITIAEWAQRCWSDIRGALLVAPADVDRLPFFDKTPLWPLPFPSLLVASENDPYLTLERARLFARHWGSRLVNLGPAGHINVESGFGPWPAGEALLDELRTGAIQSAAAVPLRPALGQSY